MMQERGVLSIRLVIQVLVALFVVSFVGVLLQYGGVFQPNVVEMLEVEDLNLDGVVLSMKPERFQHTKEVLESIGLKVTQKVPPSYQSKDVDRSLESFVGSRAFHTSVFLKVWSNRMAFLEALEDFVQDSSITDKTWRFFFEDDISVHPSLTSDRSKLLVAKGLKLAENDGFLYLGICGPNCTLPGSPLDKEIEAARCAGTCAHAFGFTRWKAGKFLTEMSALTLKGPAGPVLYGFYFDRYMYEYGNQVQRVWVVGSNLKSPVTSVKDHYGLLFQDRALYPSTIS